MTKYFNISQIPHLENSRADTLARSASTDTVGVLPAIPSLRQPTVATVKTALRITPKTPTGESPYSLAFSIEVVLPLEVVFPTLRIENFTPEASEIGLRENLDLLEERRAKAHLKTLHYHRVVARLYNRRI
ncbi:hypothetical protein BHM03_00007174 [Ensete ventricosum]|nr:hypothetical protein BHM03_00007174 [Ensete ventricosum]